MKCLQRAADGGNAAVYPILNITLELRAERIYLLSLAVISALKRAVCLNGLMGGYKKLLSR